MSATWNFPVVSIRDLGLRDAEDGVIYQAAKVANVVVLTKDADFAELVERLGPPPQVLWLRCGNSSNAALRALLTAELPEAMRLLNTGEAMVELGLN
jgi:predicted nuclease of predicted toxin-antitoxin system